ncbi:TauD/TfdA family dioxygenase [Merismopedia glauca]|uniref:TauD/TfdA-like domain-containing protein n=1 Tax=Merismopedia glauca CCAP 1448/3 TaxID=1296344 RepID=A0A2T1C1P7_9CYAN|nr:TauD/TfdA family dioxygenase [Merismopedia glauca]PSB02098.1 hypothetical protein C7B64_14830 [Merismopedia glauca CCAP 1448/3]
MNSNSEAKLGTNQSYLDFQGDKKFVNTLLATSIMQMESSQRWELLKNLSQNGAVIVQCYPCQNPQQNLLALPSCLGKIISHNLSDASGIVSVKCHLENTAYVNATSQELTLHTDGTFERQSIRIIALQSVIAANKGGLSILVDGKDVYQHIAKINPKQLPILFEPDVLTVTRDRQTASKPIFSFNKNGELQIAFRCDQTAQITVKPEAVEVFVQIKQFVENPAHQLRFKLEPHQILILDNTRMLHGRTEFDESEPRFLNRLWFDGNLPHLQLGFVPNL